MTPQEWLRQLPAVDKLLQAPAGTGLIARFGRPQLVEALRQILEQRRAAILGGQAGGATTEQLLDEATKLLELWFQPTLRPVINGTGVIIHTNLGRAPLSQAAIAAIQQVAAGYSNLEYDLPAGERGSRSVHAAQLLTHLSGAEAALVVNNNAAAILLMLTSLAHGREVIISRGQLVEIGGGFRVPEVMAQSGAKLVEIGTTNRTHLRDYAKAITPHTAAILVAHHSNFKIIGFTSEPSLAELADLAHQHHLPLLFDQGSGALLDTGRYGLSHEPMVQTAIKDGADVVAFSGDKLLGGPQAGILAGRSQLIDQIKSHPLARAVRADKLCLAGLAATLQHYLLGQALSQIPVWQMVSRPEETIAHQAHQWVAALQSQGVMAMVTAGQSTVGGGSLPGATLPTWLIAIAHPHPDLVAAGLRANTPPIIGRIANNHLLFDPRTILPHQEEQFIAALLRYLLQHNG